MTVSDVGLREWVVDTLGPVVLLAVPMQLLTGGFGGSRDDWRIACGDTDCLQFGVVGWDGRHG